MFLKSSSIVFLILTQTVWAEDTPLTPERLEAVVVTATRTETPEDAVASSTTVISQKEIRSKQRTELSDLLRDVPGLTVSNAGGAGRTTYVSMRGSDSGHTLVLIDGIEMNDAMSTSSSFDFGNLGIQDVQRIEVVRGSQSVLYGSNATGGVVNVITKKGRPDGKAASSVEGEYGTYNTYRIQGNTSGGTPSLSYYLGAGRKASDGFPAADKNLGNNLNAGNAVNSGTLSLASESIPRTKVELTARGSFARFDLAATGGPPGYDAFGGRTGEDPGQKGTDDQVYGKILARTRASSAWTPELAVSYGTIHRTSEHVPNTLNPAETHATFDSRRARVSLQSDLALGDHTLTVGAEGADERGDSTEIYSAGGPDVGLKGKRDVVLGAFAQEQWLTETFFVTGGARYDAHRDLQSRATYRAAPGVHLPGTATTLRGSLGTGFKVPSLYQRFSGYGDPGLKPESSVSWDVGVDQGWGRDGRLGLTYFHTTFEDLIDYDFATSHYANVGRASTRGVETSLRWEVSRKLELSSSYTYLMTRDERTGLELLRRARHQLALGADRHFSDRLQLGAQARFVGARDDLDAVSSNRVRMPAYAVFYLTARYQVSPDIRVFGRVDNVFDRAYEEVNGFGTPGRSFFIGAGKEL